MSAHSCVHKPTTCTPATTCIYYVQIHSHHMHSEHIPNITCTNTHLAYAHTTQTIHTKKYIMYVVPLHTPHMHTHNTWSHTCHTCTPHTYRIFTQTVSTPNSTKHSRTDIYNTVYTCNPGPMQIYRKFSDTFFLFLCVSLCLSLSLLYFFPLNPRVHIYWTTQSTHTDPEQNSGLM